jgi:REP-associated tyrosine transposase
VITVVWDTTKRVPPGWIRRLSGIYTPVPMEGAASSAPKLFLQMSQSEIGRKHLAHPAIIERHNEPVIIYLTVCSKDRKSIFAFDNRAVVIVDAWQKASLWLVGRYVIMPDHIHHFCAPNTFPMTPLKQWVKYWKALASLSWPCPNNHPIWQRDAWDTQLRRYESYDSKWEYVISNPVRAGLVKEPNDWSFQGELNILPW